MGLCSFVLFHTSDIHRLEQTRARLEADLKDKADALALEQVCVRVYYCILSDLKNKANAHYLKDRSTAHAVEFACICMCVYMFMDLCMCIYAYVHMCICTYIYIYALHTHICLYT